MIELEGKSLNNSNVSNQFIPTLKFFPPNLEIHSIDEHLLDLIGMKRDLVDFV